MYSIDLDGQVALVTGGIAGIGLATCRLLAQAGARVVVCDLLPRDDPRVGPGLAAITATGGPPPIYLEFNLSTRDGCERMVKAARNEAGRIDVFVANAAVVGNGGRWSEAFDVNAVGVYETAEMLRDDLERTNGRICVMTSASILTGSTGIPEYIASKGAAHALIRYLARTYAPLGIRVNGVAPAVIMTDMTLTRFGSEQAMIDHYRGRLPLNRIGTVEDVAGAVLFLASELSNWMTGETLLLDGGRLYLN